MNMTYKDFDRYLRDYPNKEGFFGDFGGQFIPDELVPAFKEINDAYETICHSAQFINELRRIRKDLLEIQRPAVRRSVRRRLHSVLCMAEAGTGKTSSVIRSNIKTEYGNYR